MVTDPTVTSGRLRSGVGAAAAAFLGLVLLAAALLKAVDPAAFAEQIRGEGLDFLMPAAALAVLAIGIEIAIGVALVIGLRGRRMLSAVTALVVFFLLLTGRAYWKWSHGLIEADASCGCFGNLIDRTPAEAFWQDLLLLVPALVLAWWGRPGHELTRKAARRRAIVATGLAASVMLFAVAAPALPLDDLVTRLGPGDRIADLCSGSDAAGLRVCLDALIPDLESGTHLVVLSGLDNPELLASLEELNALALAGGPRVWLLSSDPPDAHGAFFWEHGPSFEVREVPLPLVRPLYRSLPRSFELEDGSVTRTWNGLPPAARVTGS